MLAAHHSRDQATAWPGVDRLTTNMRGNDLLAGNGEVAIVDDDESIRVAIKTLLESLGQWVQEFCSAEAFLNAGRFHNFDCLILDVRMPGLGGLELQRRLSDDNNRIPIVFITAHYSEEDRTKDMEAGAIAFLSKPFSEGELLTSIRLALASRTDAPGRYSADSNRSDE